MAFWKLDLRDGRTLGPWEGTKPVARVAALRALGRNGRLPRGSRLVRYNPTRRSIESVPPFEVVERRPVGFNVLDGKGRVVAADGDERRVRERARLWNEAGRSFPVFSRYAKEAR